MRKFLGLIFFVVTAITCFIVIPSSTFAASSPEEFCSRYIGKSVDVDDYPANQPYQCYDLWARFIMDEYGTSSPIIISPTGLAKDIWNNFDGLGLSAYFTKVAGDPKDGDWVIYDKPGTTFSHVGMFRADNGDGTITILHQNNQGQTKVTQDSFTKKHILGYIRPKKYINEEKESRSGEGVDKDQRREETGNRGTRPIRVTVDGTPVVFDQPPVILDGRVMVPMRAIFEALGAKVHWEVGKQVVTAVKNKNTIIASIGSKQATVNGREQALDIPAQIINNRTMVPVRFISESLGAKVSWSVRSQTVTIHQ